MAVVKSCEGARGGEGGFDRPSQEAHDNKYINRFYTLHAIALRSNINLKLIKDVISKCGSISLKDLTVSSFLRTVECPITFPIK